MTENDKNYMNLVPERLIPHKTIDKRNSILNTSMIGVI